MEKPLAILTTSRLFLNKIEAGFGFVEVGHEPIEVPVRPPKRLRFYRIGPLLL